MFNTACLSIFYQDFICLLAKKRSDSVLLQKTLYKYKIKKAVTTQKRHQPPKCPITQRLRTDMGRLIGLTIATQLLWSSG